MTRATLDSWCSCGVRGTAVHMVGECPRTGTPAPQPTWDRASPPPAATATEPQPREPLLTGQALQDALMFEKAPRGTMACLASAEAEVAALRAERDALRAQAEQDRIQAVATVEGLWAERAALRAERDARRDEFCRERRRVEKLTDEVARLTAERDEATKRMIVAKGGCDYEAKRADTAEAALAALREALRGLRCVKCGLLGSEQGTGSDCETHRALATAPSVAPPQAPETTP